MNLGHCTIELPASWRTRDTRPRLLRSPRTAGELEHIVEFADLGSFFVHRRDLEDDEHRFELATQLGKLQMAADIIVSITAQAGQLPAHTQSEEELESSSPTKRVCAQANPGMPPRGKWKNLGDVALEQGI